MKFESLKVQGSKLSDLCLYFVIPGTEFELVKNGKHVKVELSNIEEYI